MSEPSRGRVIRSVHIVREHLRAHPDTLYLYGDNMLSAGLGGQAKEMRGEPNAKGVPTKWAPTTDETAYFVDADLDDASVRSRIDYAFAVARTALLAGKDVVIPTDGFGTGRAQLRTRAPRILDYINLCISNLEKFRG